ncbi:hypothetical protein BSQ44_01055 [Aquibium oceanicum]|uniref:Uncharacterized protein n=1 Tax=Aquibium oceanicum TaxID=1670800 RepID=A0A1L3SL47_9HYPH|nr:hypothetical protein BSQ44_01055 [Aquibium oceanicum]
MVKLLPPQCAASLLKRPGLRNEHQLLLLWYYQICPRVKDVDGMRVDNQRRPFARFSLFIMPLSWVLQASEAILAAERKLGYLSSHASFGRTSSFLSVCHWREEDVCGACRRRSIRKR